MVPECDTTNLFLVAANGDGGDLGEGMAGRVLGAQQEVVLLEVSLVSLTYFTPPNTLFTAQQSFHASGHTVTFFIIMYCFPFRLCLYDYIQFIVIGKVIL